MKAQIAHSMDGNKELLAGLETAKSEAATIQKLAKEGVSLLRKAEKEKKVAQVEAHRLAEEKTTMAVENEKGGE